MILDEENCNKISDHRTDLKACSGVEFITMRNPKLSVNKSSKSSSFEKRKFWAFPTIAG